jgi:hypothetical protein
MNPFDLYPYPEDAHPEAPMWSRRGHGGGWFRSVDGAALARLHGGAGWALTLPGEDPIPLHVREVAGVGPDGQPNSTRYDDGAALVYADREYPPAPPPVRVGQVWVVPEDGGRVELHVGQILREKDGYPHVLFPVILEDGEIEWRNFTWSGPPAGGVMVRDFDGPTVWTPIGWSASSLGES